MWSLVLNTISSFGGDIDNEMVVWEGYVYFSQKTKHRIARKSKTYSWKIL
jgi:hypothetical protein